MAPIRPPDPGVALREGVAPNLGQIHRSQLKPEIAPPQETPAAQRLPAAAAENRPGGDVAVLSERARALSSALQAVGGDFRTPLFSGSPEDAAATLASQVTAEPALALRAQADNLPATAPNRLREG